MPPSHSSTERHSNCGPGLSVLGWHCVGLGLVLLLGSGCQSLQPFAQRTQEKLLSAREWANGGLEAFQTGKLQQATGFFARASAESPTDFRVRANLARALHQSGETDAAIPQMQQAVDLSGGDLSLTVELGQMYLTLGQLAPASRLASTAIDRDPQFAPAWQLQGRVHAARGDYGPALVSYQRAAGFDDHLAGLHLDIAKAYQARQQPLKALATIEHFLARHPVERHPEEAVLVKSDLLLALDQHTSALAMLENAAGQSTASPAILAQLAKAQMQSGRLTQARMTIERGREAFPEAPQWLALSRQADQQIHAATQRMAATQSGAAMAGAQELR